MVPKPDGFLSYTRFDDRRGKITEFRQWLSEAVQEISGKPFQIFQDVDDEKGIALGQKWKDVLDEMLDQARFFIPILTPSFFESKPCRAELKKFLELEQKAGREDLVLPIYYIECPVLEDPSLVSQDALVAIVGDRQRWNWRKLRHRPFTDAEVAEQLEALARQIERARWVGPLKEPKRVEPLPRSAKRARGRAEAEVASEAKTDAPELDTAGRVSETAIAGQGSRFFIAYCPTAADDRSLAIYLKDDLEKEGHDVFVDLDITVGTDWVAKIAERIEWCDYLVVLLSEDSIHSETVLGEVRLARQSKKDDDRPTILPIRVRYDGALDHELNSYLHGVQYLQWAGGDDSARVVAEIRTAIAGQGFRFFVAYCPAAADDRSLAIYLKDSLEKEGHEVFIDLDMTAGTDWIAKIDERIEWCDYLVVLLSPESVHSEVVLGEVRRAHRRRRQDGGPYILPIRVRYDDALDYELDSYLARVQYLRWAGEDDSARVVAEIRRSILQRSNNGGQNWVQKSGALPTGK